MLFICLYLFLAGVGLGLWAGLECPLPPVRYDHFHTKTRLVLVSTTDESQRRVVIEWDGEAWDRAQDELVKLFTEDRLRISELQGTEECMEFLGRR